MLKPSNAAVLLSLSALASMCLYVYGLLIPQQRAEAFGRKRPRGNLSDLYPRWLGARELLLRGRDPYSSDLTREIQAGYYGRPIDPARSSDPKDQQAFAYPLYVVWVLAPTVKLPFAIVQRAFLCLLILVTAASVLLWTRALRWRVSTTSTIVWIILVLGCFPAIQGFKLQQLTLLVAALLAGAMACIVQRRFVPAGILLALATIKPQLVSLLAIWMLVWILGNWRERQRLFWSAAASVAMLVIASELLLPGWIHEFRAAMSAYYQYTGGGTSVLDAALTPVLGRIVSIALIAALVFLLWRMRRETEGSPGFQWSLTAVLATTLIMIPMFAPYNQVLLIPCVMLAVKEIRKLWNASRLSRFFVAIAISSIAWPWVAALALATALLFLPASRVQRLWALPMGTTLMIPVSIAALMFIGRKTILTASSGPQQHNP
jgi:hypothetical protein